MYLGYLIEFGMDDIGVLVPVVNIDPHLRFYVSIFTIGLQGYKHYFSESTQSSEDAPADPGTVFPLRRCKNLYSHVFDG